MGSLDELDDAEDFAEYEAELAADPLRNEIRSNLDIERPRTAGAGDGALADEAIDALIAQRSGEQPSETELAAALAERKREAAAQEFVDFAREQAEASRLKAEIARSVLVADQELGEQPDPSIFERLDDSQFGELLKARDAGLDYLPSSTVKAEEFSRSYAEYSQRRGDVEGDDS